MESRDPRSTDPILQKVADASLKQGQPDPRQRTLALAMELCKRAAELETLDDLYFFFVNDLRVLLEFDRCFLITHMGSRSHFAAANNQPILQSKSELYGCINRLAPHLLRLEKGLFLSDRVEDLEGSSLEMDSELKSALTSYIAIAGCRYCFLVPLFHKGQPIAHLIFDFVDQRLPEQVQLVAVLQVAPLFGSMLAEAWILDRKPDAAYLLEPGRASGNRVRRWSRRYLLPLLVVVPLLVAGLFFVPVDYTVGGEAVVTPWQRHVAFCNMNGLIDSVKVHEGSHVKRDQALAELDSTDLDFRIQTAKRQAAILKKKMDLLAYESDSEPSKLGERTILALERAKVLKELEYLRWQQQFLQVRSPVGGIILTKHVESLAGKKMSEGEAFCEIAVPGELAVNIFVPDTQAPRVKIGQTVHVYLNNNPLRGYQLQVDETSPTAEAVSRLGNVCRVKARFTHVPESVKVGMKGVGKIETGTTTVWYIIQQGILNRWNQLSLYF